MRRQERGASYIPLIIAVVFLIVAVVWAWVKTDEADQFKKENIRLAAENVQIKDERIEQGNYFTNKLAPLVGFAVAQGATDKWGSDADAIRAFLLEMLTALKETYVREFPTNVYTVQDGGGVKIEEVGDKVKIAYVKPVEIPSEAKLDQLYRHMDGALSRMLTDITRLVALLDQEKRGREADRASSAQVVTLKDATISQKSDEYNTLQTSTAKQISDLNGEKDDLETRNRELEEELDSEKEASRVSLAALNNQLLAKTQDVVKLKERRKANQEPIGPDGKVIAASAGQGTVVLDKGKDKHMMAGLRFAVYDYGKGAVKRSKGYVEIIEVLDYTCRARVIELFSQMNPIVEGDEFENAAYNPNEVMHFYLLGRFNKYGKSDAARRLEMIGVKVDSEIGIYTDYVVLGAPENDDENLRDSDAYKRAMELGIQVITEAQLSQFLLY